MIKCICVDRDKKSREATVEIIKKIKGLKMVKSYPALDTAFKACKTNNIQILFVRLYLFPLPAVRKMWLKKIAETGTKIIIISTRIVLADDASGINADDFILLPTSSRRLWKAVKKALKIIDFGIETPEKEVKNLLML